MIIEFQTDAEYYCWLEEHPHGFVLNTRRPASPDYMVLHRASCTSISHPLHEASPGGFTERDYLKVGSDDINSLCQWVAAHGRPDGTFTNECGRCRPTSLSGERTLPQPEGQVSSEPRTLQIATSDNSLTSPGEQTDWQLWEAGPVQRCVEGITPLLASWEKSTHPSQVRLREYLDSVVTQLLPLPEDVPLFLQLEVDVEDPAKLLRHYDLENYLTPLFGSRWLPSNRFALVTATKYVGGGSRIAWGVATPAASAIEDGWSHFSINAGRGASHHEWKERIRSSLESRCPAPLPPGQAHVRLAWRCSEQRNWSTFWKRTGDAMGPVLGCENANRPYHLNDDRITTLELHRNIDDQLGHDVVVGMWWRTAK